MTDTPRGRILRWEQGAQPSVDTDELAGEEPLEIRVGGRAVSVTMRTPGEDEELALGFLLAPALHAQAAPWGRSAPQGIGHEPRPTKPVGQEQAGYWGVRTPGGDGQERITAQPYYPQPGDILLYNFRDPKISFALRLVGTGAPMHAARWARMLLRGLGGGAGRATRGVYHPSE